MENNICTWKAFHETAHAYLQKYDLDRVWSITFNKRCKCSAFCDFDRHVLSFSIYFVTHTQLSRAIKINTILHEIAHAIVGYENGHNDVWQKKAREIGCNANIKGRFSIKEKHIIYACTCGKTKKKFYKKTGKRYICPHCSHVLHVTRY